jgi:hypothetical protein
MLTMADAEEIVAKMIFIVHIWGVSEEGEKEKR